MIIKSLENLNSISKKVADQIKVNDIIYLLGEIGVGKTTFTRYLINYLQKKENLKVTEVLSPTFNLLYEYDFKNFKIRPYPNDWDLVEFMPGADPSCTREFRFFWSGL